MHSAVALTSAGLLGGRPLLARPSKASGHRALAPARLPCRASFKEDEDMKEKVEKVVKPAAREIYRTSSSLPAFTRRREHTIGRVAAIGFAFSLCGELLAGIGPITQLHYETGISYKWLYLALIGASAWGLLGVLLPSSPTYDPQNLRDSDMRRTMKLANPLTNPRKFLAQNEVLVGRLAMAGFAGACVLEWLWGGEAPLVHLGLVQSPTQLLSAPLWAEVTILLFLANGLGLFSALGSSGRDTDAF